MITHIAILLLALAFLAKGADFFVEYCARIAKRMGVSDFIIGLTVASVGTSVPELAASISASLDGYPGLIIGNVVGSNIANIGLILGVSAAFRAFRTEKQMYERDGFIMIASVLLFFAFAYDNRIATAEAVLLIAGYLFYVLFLIHGNRERRAYHFSDFMKYVFDFEYISPLRSKLFQTARKKEPEQRTASERQMVRVFTLDFLKDLLVILLACAAVLGGAHFLVEEAVWLAKLLAVPESVIGLSVIAVGTSLPELTVSVSAVRKGKGEMVVGNVVGSTIANTLLIIGISGSIRPMQVAELSVVYTIPIMLFFCLALLYFIQSDWQIKRWQGILAIIAYIAFMALAFIREWS